MDELRDYHYIEWDKIRDFSKVSAGDYVYLYETIIHAIRFKFVVTESPVPVNEMTDCTEYGGTNTRESGATVFRMSPVGYCESDGLEYRKFKDLHKFVNTNRNAKQPFVDYLESIFIEDDESGEKKAIDAIIKLMGPSRKNRSFFDYLNDNGLYYPVELIEDFLLSLKSKQLLILSGGSGNGKTKIAQVYGRYLSDTYGHNDAYSIVPVGSNWTENRFIIGYKNALTGKYNTTRSLDLIIKSNENPNQPHLLILDEMNLSHVERYFSDLLSAIESKENIILDTDEVSSEDRRIPKNIEIKNNLFIIGTINVDETTYSFSPKVLDRANVIEFDTIFASEYLSNERIIGVPSGDIKFLENCMDGIEVRTMNANEIIKKMIDGGIESNITDLMIQDIDQLQRLMDGMNLPVGFRTIDEIFRFIYVSWVYMGKGKFDCWKRFMDSQIKQKILPKIHGNMSIYDNLEKMKKYCINSNYDKSAQKLTDMANILEKQRYVSFNCC